MLLIELQKNGHMTLYESVDTGAKIKLYQLRMIFELFQEMTLDIVSAAGAIDINTMDVIWLHNVPQTVSSPFLDS